MFSLKPVLPFFKVLIMTLLLSQNSALQTILPLIYVSKDHSERVTLRISIKHCCLVHARNT